MITGPANCGKSFLIGPLSTIFRTFQNPATSSFAWVGVEDAEVIVLNDFRWSQQVSKVILFEQRRLMYTVFAVCQYFSPLRKHFYLNIKSGVSVLNTQSNVIIPAENTTILTWLLTKS